MKFILSILISGIAVCSLAQTDAGRVKHLNTRNNLALEGYDPVSYFQGKPREGKEEIRFTYQGITYYFSSVTNLNAFKSNPTNFEPAYGGWCAYAMGDTGEKVKVDPETFKIADGRLYLFYNFWGNNTLEEWNKNEITLRKEANRNWKKFIQ